MRSKRGTLIKCDVPMKQFLIYLDQREDFPSFIIDANIDEMHLFVDVDDELKAAIRQEIILWQRENNFIVDPNE